MRVGCVMDACWMRATCMLRVCVHATCMLQVLLPVCCALHLCYMYAGVLSALLPCVVCVACVAEFVASIPATDPQISQLNVSGNKVNRRMGSRVGEQMDRRVDGRTNR